MLKDKIEENFEKLSKEKESQNKDDKMGLEFRGELEIWAIKGGKVIHHDKGNNIVTKWAKHATMHLLTSESYSTHGDRDISNALSTQVSAFTKRQIGASDHVVDTNNIDGTIISDKNYLGDNEDYYWTRSGGTAGDTYGYWTSPHPDVLPDDSVAVGDNPGDATAFKYPFFPTKMLFGTGIEYASWADVTTDGTIATNCGNNYAYEIGGRSGGNYLFGYMDATAIYPFLLTSAQASTETTTPGTKHCKP